MAAGELHYGALTSVNTGLSIPWVQYVGRSHPSPTSFSLAWGSNQATLTIDINFTDLLTAIPQILGTATRVVSPGAQVTGAIVTSPGSGYQTPPDVQFVGGGGRGAQAVATLNGSGQVASVALTDGGTNYLTPPSIILVGGAPPSAAFSQATATATVTPITLPLISRTMPMRFPYLEHMICTRIQQGQPFVFTGKDMGAPAVTIPIPASAIFNYCRLTLFFEAPDYIVMDDSSLQSKFGGDESARFVSWKRVNTLYALNRRGADFVWAETSTTGTEGPKLGDPIKFGLLQELAKQQITAKWLHIPESALFPNGVYGPSPNIDSAYGCINNQTWNSWPAGTVFFDNWRPEQEPSPYPFSSNPWLVPQRLWSVEFSLRIFNPKTDPGNPTHGWNCQPWVDGQWYFASQAKNRGEGVLRTADLGSLFTPN